MEKICRTTSRLCHQDFGLFLQDQEWKEFVKDLNMKKKLEMLELLVKK